MSDEKKRRMRQVSDDRRARKELKALVGRDKGKTPGGEYLALSRARRAAQLGAGAGEGRGSSSGEEDEGGSGDEADKAGAKDRDKKPGIFRPEALRRIGYNPTVKAGESQRDESDEAKRHRVRLLLSVPPSLMTTSAAR